VLVWQVPARLHGVRAALRAGARLLAGQLERAAHRLQAWAGDLSAA
jgi:hypothetical protein